MLVYRIAKSEIRARDLTGTGAAKFGGRWNNKGTYMLYISINSSLAYLENLVHFDESDLPANLYITTIEIKDDHLIYQLPEADYPAAWEVQENAENKIMGDKWMREVNFLAFKVRSAINPTEHNLLLNPLFPGYHDKISIIDIHQLRTDTRLIR